MSGTPFKQGPEKFQKFEKEVGGGSEECFPCWLGIGGGVLRPILMAATALLPAMKHFTNKNISREFFGQHLQYFWNNEI